MLICMSHTYFCNYVIDHSSKSHRPPFRMVLVPSKYCLMNSSLLTAGMHTYNTLLCISAGEYYR